MSEVNIADTEDAFAKSAGRQLLIFAMGAILTLGILMWGLQTLASLVGSSTVAAKAVDHVNNTISISLLQEPPQLNSTKATDVVSGIILGHVMEGLLRMDMKDQLEAAIAYKWEVTETGAKFWLREDAKWSDGVTVTAHDFVFAWRTVVNPENASKYAFLLFPIKNAREVNEGKLPLTELGVRALDDFTLEVDLPNPTPFFDKMVTFQTYMPVREDFYHSTNGRYGADAKDLLSTGPYILTSWVHGASLYMSRNPYYWNQDRVHLDGINVAYITSDANAILNFFKDEKIAYTELGAENLENALKQRWHINRVQDGVVFYAEFNHRDDRITRNVNFRRALQLVIDMDELVYKVIKLPGYLPGESLFPVWLVGVDDRLRKEYPAPELRLNHELALEHLAKAKEELGLDEWPSITVLTGDTATSSLQSEWMQGLLKTKLGLDVKIDKQIFKQRLEKMTAGDFDIVLGGWGPDYDDPMTFGDLFTSWNANNRGQYKNPELDRLIDVAQTSSDKRTRMDAFGGVQQILFDDVVILPMYESGSSYVVHQDLKNVKRRVIGPEVDFTSAYIERP